MTLFENPIFVTHRRLTLRAGILAPALIAALVGASLVAGAIAALANRTSFRFITSEQVGKAFYGWVVGLELAVLALGGFAHVWHRVVEDRKSGLWESNRVTPLGAADLVLGYWFGAPLREAIMGAILAAAGLAIIVLSGAPLLLWLLTQLLIVSTVALVWLFAVVIGLVLERAIVPIALVCLLLGLQGVSFTAPEVTLTSFVVPISTIAGLFENAHSQARASLPSVFGVVVHPLILTWLVQLVLGLVLWRGATRNAANPFGSFLSRAESVACVACLVWLQHGLIWSYKASTETVLGYISAPHALCLITNKNHNTVLVFTHVGTLVLAIVMLTVLSPIPERIRVASLRDGTARLGVVYSRSMVITGLGLTSVIALAYLTHLAHCRGESYKTQLAVILMNVATLLVIVPALLDLSRLSFRRRASGFFALGLFALFLLPYILAAVFSNEAIARFCLLSPGVLALSEPRDDLLTIASVHLVFAAVVLLFWRHAWARLLSKTTNAQAPQANALA